MKAFPRVALAAVLVGLFGGCLGAPEDPQPSPRPSPTVEPAWHLVLPEGLQEGKLARGGAGEHVILGGRAGNGNSVVLSAPARMNGSWGQVELVPGRVERISAITAAGTTYFVATVIREAPDSKPQTFFGRVSDDGPSILEQPSAWANGPHDDAVALENGLAVVLDSAVSPSLWVYDFTAWSSIEITGMNTFGRNALDRDSTYLTVFGVSNSYETIAVKVQRDGTLSTTVLEAPIGLIDGVHFEATRGKEPTVLYRHLTVLSSDPDANMMRVAKEAKGNWAATKTNLNERIPRVATWPFGILDSSSTDTTSLFNLTTFEMCKMPGGFSPLDWTLLQSPEPTLRATMPQPGRVIVQDFEIGHQENRCVVEH